MPVYKLNGQTYDIPDNVVANFEKDNPSATVAYQVGKDVYDIPVKERKGFLSQFPDAVLEGQQPKQPAQAAQTQQQPLNPSTPQPPQVQQGTSPLQMPQGFGQRDPSLTRQMSLGKGPVSWEQPQQEPKQETDFDKAMRVTRGQGTEAENKQVQKRLQQRQDAITYKQETGDENGMNGDLLRQKVLNPEWEAATLSRDEYGNLRRGDDGKLLTGFSTDQDVVAASKQINDELASQQLALTKEEQAEVKLNEAYEERKKLQDEMAKLYQASLVDGNSKGAEDAINMLESAARQNEKSIIALEAEMADQGQGQFWQGFIDAAKDADTYTFGITGLVDAGRLMSIKNKMDRGEQLTDAEQRLLQNTNLNNIAQSEFGSNRGALYRFGGISMQALPFIAEFMSTGGFSALGNATTKGFTSMFGKYASKKFIQNTGIALGDIVAATAMANTTGAARTYSDIINRNIGDVVRDEKGNYAFEGGVGLGEAFYKGQVANTLEYYTEKLGEHLKLGQWLAKGADKAGLSKLSKAISYVSKNPWLERGGVQDYPSEVVEEQANLLLNAMLVGDNTFGSPDDPKSVINPETQTDIWGGMLFSIGLMQGPRFINTGRKYAGYKMYQTATNAASSRAEDVFSPDKWQAVKNQIDNTENQNLSEVLSQVITGNMTQEQKEATMYYADNLLKMRGYNVSLMNDLRDRDEDIAERGLNNSYMQGYNAKDPAQRQQINDAVAQSEAELSKYGNSFVYLVTDESHNPMAVLDFMSNNRIVFTDQQIQAATAYYMAKSSQQGVEDSDKEDADLAEASKSSRVSYTLKEQRVGGKWVVNSFDSKGNLIRSEEFDTKDDTDAFIGRVKMEQQMRAFNDYLNTQEVINNPQAIADFEAQNGWEPGTVADLAKTDPFRMTDEEWQMADQARDFLKGIAYPSTELHTETSAQEGIDTAEAVVEQVLSPEEPIDPQNNAGKEIREQFQAAEAALNQMFANDKTGDIEDHINSMKDSSPQEILSSLDTFRPEQRQVLIDYFNAKAKYDAFMNVAANKINEEAANSRQRHTFKGTIDGQADLNHVHTITDGTNRYYLVSGDITTDPATGQITGSTSGLIIGMDLDGSFVQLNESDGYSVEPAGPTLDQFEEAERIRLQEAVSLTIDPNGAAQAAAGQAQQSGNLDNAGGEAGTDNGTGANNPPATAPVAENTNQGTQQSPSVPKKAETGTQQPAVTIESVTDKDGIKRYENGISVDDAIADIQNDGFDVNEISDASIAEAQQAIDKIDKKQTKTRKDLVDKKKAQDVITYYNNVKARWAEMNQPAESEENVNVQPEEPIVPEKNVSSQSNLTVEEQKQQRIAEAKAKYGELFDDDFTKANDVYELVSMWIGRKRNLAWDDVSGKRGLQKELGWTRKIGGDTKFIETLLAKKGEGMGVDEFVHMVWESPENDVNGEKRFDTDAIKEALLDLLKSAQSKSDVVDYALNSRIAQAEAALQQQQEREAEEAQNATDEEVAPFTAEEIAHMEANLPFVQSTDEEIPDSPIVQLANAIAELQQQEGMPPISLVNTDRMSDDEWYDIASQAYGGAFVSQEDIDDLRNTILADGVYVNPETGAITVYSDSQTAEEVKYKVEQINDILNGRSNEEETGRLEAEDVQRPEEGTGSAQEPETPAAEGANEPESQGSTGSAVDDYLQPRNAEEEQIIANVLAQLQQEIGDAVEDANKARTELEKARAKESERATDLFANDNALNQEGQLFDNSDMPVDNSVEGIERRTAPEREKLQEAVNQLNRLQSLEERNSRIRGALDNYRRQTKIETEEQEPVSDPIEAIEQAAQQFRQEQEEKKAYGADNKLVSKDRYEELKKRMRDKLLGQMNLGVDPEILAIGTEMAVYHIEAGARKFIDYATNMINDLGDAIRPYLKAFYEGARRLPEMSELSKEMDSVSDVDAFDVLNYDKQPANTVNEHKEKDNEAENVVSSQQNTEETVERKAEDADKYRAFSQAVANDMLNAMETGEKPYKSINDIRKKAKQIGLDVDDEGRTDILLQELVEDGLVSAARQYVNTYVMQQVLAGKSAQEVRSSRDLFNDIVKLYELQPSITQRSSNRIKMGQFSTPLPMSFVADVFATPSVGDVLEPTAGNGMMVFAVPESMVHANELDNTRLENLKAQKFKKVTNQDATQPFEGDEQYDAIIANPPFGSAPAKDYDGKSISGLAEQIALNALSKMKDDGKAAIIIGGNMDYAPNGAIKNDKAFFTYLYDHYNVKGVIDMDGKLFSRQGTTFPTRMILIDGRRSEEERAQTKVYPPVKSLAPKKATTFEELYDIAEEIRNNKYKTNGNEVLRTSGPMLGTDNSNASGQTNGRRRSGQPDANGSNAGRGIGRVDGQPRSNGRNQQDVTEGVQQPSGVVSVQNGAGRLSDVSGQQPVTNEPAAGTNNGGGSTRSNGRVQSERSGDVQTGGQRNERVEEKRELTSDKLPYRPHNTAFSLESVAPASMVEAMDNTLKDIEKEYGNIDDFVTKELGYDSVEEMHNALAAEQVDSVAMAIWNMKKGEGMIIGDQTGVGKGRQMAALIRWACRQGKKPIFVTKDSDLFSDIYRDLADIGSGDLRPFIFNASKVSTDKETGEKKYEGGFMLDVNGSPIYRSLGSAEQAKIFKTDELPQGYDYVVLSYTQMNTGDAISQEESGKSAKERGERGSKKGKAVKAGRPTPKADFLRRIAKDNYLLMDESQNAAGSGNTGAYFQSILKDAKAVTFASATFAKRPDTMPLYAIRTAISKAKVKTWELLMMIGKGGVTLQEIMSRAMTQAGQMVRRERDMSDVRTDWKTIDDKETAEKARRNYDNVMRAFNAIIDFQDNYIKPALAAKSIEFASMASSVSSRRGTEKAGVDNPPFVNRLYNFSKQLLLSLKVDAVVEEVAKEIEAGRHPVIALENTLESALGDYGLGDVIEDPTLFGKLKKGLDATFRYTLTDENGNEAGGELQPHELGSEGEHAYYDLVDLIKESTQGMFISPLDAITDKLENKGYKVGEISGRKTRAVLNDEGQYVVRKRENTDRKKLARDFNSGAVDVLIINKTGSTGISLHASKRFSDQRQRTMIMAQPLSDINDYMQMIGRIDRTGQVHRGYYINLGLPVPAETRFMMMLANKLKSLNANTTTSQENKDNDVDAPDLLNKYGDQVMIEYLRDNTDVYRKLGEFLKDGKERGSEGVSAARLDEYQPKEGDARQITGRVALLSVDEQDAFYDDVTRRYNELIKYLNDTGSNDLKISVLPLNARTIDREVSSEGTAPNSGNPFADNAYVEWVDMDILKKPMKASEVGKTIDQLNPKVEAPKVEAKTAAQEKALNGKLTPRIRQIISIVEKETQEKLDKENERYEAAKKRAEEDIEAKADTINKQQKRTPEQKKEAIDKYTTEKRQSVEESHQNMVNKIDANHERLMRYLKMFEVGDSVLVPDDLTTDAFLGSSNGIFCGFKTKDEGITPSTTLAVFATLDGRRKIEVKLSDWGALTRIDNMTEQNWDAAHEVTLSNWDEKIPSSSRKKGYIMTGNILQAISDTNFQGRLVTFTDDKGNVRDGVLMPDKWEPSQLKGATVPISQRKERITSMPMKESVTSSDGRVTITRYWGYYNLDVPKSKKQGGEFYLDKTLLDLMDGNDFFTASGKMRGRVDNSNIDAVIDRLGELSVTLPSDKKVEFEEEEANARITTEDPMQAIEQASYAFRNEQGFYQRTNEELDEITKRVMDIPKRFGLKGGITQVINSRSELEQMKGKVSDEVYKLIEEGYNKKGVTGLHVSGVGIVVVFGEKVKDADDAEYTWWHEQTHNFWHSLPADLRDRYGSVCFNILQKYFPDVLDNVTGYSPDKWKNEACSFLVESIVKQYGADAFMTFKFGGNQNFINFANELREYLKNGTGQQQGHLSNNQRKGIGSISRGADAHRRDNLRRERKGSGSLLQAQSELQETEIVDPIEAIERAAADYRISKAEREEDMKDLRDESARLAYDDRINSIAFVNNEAFHDSMAGLKVGQEEIAHRKDIPDSQNAYMAENLMHGKNQIEQEAFNRLFRDPLYNAINKVLNRMEWTMKEMNRYLFTKHGLERNRELFTRDWLEAERKKRITEYSQLNTEEQEIYDKLANRIEEDFDDGIIETEEEKEKKLAQALQKAHNQHIEEVENRYYALKAENYDKLMNGEITLPEYFEKLDDYIRQNIDGGYVPEEHDYSGFTEMFGDEDGKYNEADIMANLMNDEEKMGKEALDELWNRINLANQYGLDRYLEAGMRSEEEIEKIARMFNWYVPMRGFTEEKAEDMYQYFTSPEKANSYVGGLLKRARGRKSEAKDPIFTMIAMTYKAIKDCNQNMVNQKFYRLIQANPNDLAIVSDAWAKWSEDAGAWVEVAPEFPDDATEEQIKQITLDWEDEMRHLAMGRKARKINGKADFVYKPLDKKKLDEHVVEVRMNGQKRRVTVIGNPRMAQALNGQTRYSEGDGIISKSKWFGWAPGLSRRFLKMRQALNTNYSLSFVWRNAKRDWTHFGALLAAKEGLGYAKAAEGYYFKSLRGMRKLFKKYREGTLDESNEMERDFKDFMDNGGITGFVQMQKVDEIQKDFEKLSKQLDKKGEIKLDKGFWNKIMTAIEAYNEAVENRARFATYRASRHYAGRTKARSAYDAKEVTANFNRRGAGKKTVGIKGVDEKVLAAAFIAGETSQLLNENRMFFNATVQSLATLGEGIKVADNKTRAKIFAKELAKRMVKYGTLPFVLSQLITLMNRALIYVLGGGDDDDPYANLPEWVRRNNICIYIGHGNFFTLAIGQELAAFYSLGDIIAGLTYYPALKPVDKDLKDELVGILSVFSPVDMETKVARDNAGFAETAFVNAVARVYSNYAPFIQVIENTAWTGRPIYREDRYNGDEFKPEHNMAFRGTPKFYKYVSEGLNYIGGGDEGTRGAEWLQVNPGIMEYLVEQYAGGAGRFFVNTGDVAGDAVRAALHKDQDFNVRKLEGFRVLFQQSDDRTQYYRAQVKYWKYHKEADKLEHDIDYYRKDAATNPESYMKAMELSHGDDAARLLIFKETDGDMSILRKAINSSEGQDRKDLQKLYNQNIKKIVDALDKPKEALNNLPVQ